MKNTKIYPGATIGIVGGGQLGRMMIHAASRLGYKTVVFCDKKDSPAFHVANHSITASYDDESALCHFAKLCDVVTFEFENIPYKTVQHLEAHTIVRPSWEALHISQNRIREKEFAHSLGVATTIYRAVNDQDSMVEALREIGMPCILKTTEFGYDGKGQHLIREDDSLEKRWESFSVTEGILEKCVPFKMEISLVAARGLEGEYQSFAPVQNIHKNGILDITIAPANIPKELGEKGRAISKLIMDKLRYVGVLAVEFFITEDNQLLLNEIAPRPHNSGHWTIDACCTSQFEQHIRAICGLPLGDPSWHSKARMKNLIGLEANSWCQYAAKSTAKIHLYGKEDCKPGRKMGHVTELQT